jgi:hypothetical protein
MVSTAPDHALVTHFQWSESRLVSRVSQLYEVEVNGDQVDYEQGRSKPSRDLSVSSDPWARNVTYPDLDPYGDSSRSTYTVSDAYIRKSVLLAHIHRPCKSANLSELASICTHAIPVLSKFIPADHQESLDQIPVRNCQPLRDLFLRF